MSLLPSVTGLSDHESKSENEKDKSIGGSRGCKGRTPPLGPKFHHFHALSAKSGQIVCWRPLGNPGSATEDQQKKIKE